MLVTLVLNDCTSLFMTVACGIKLKVVSKDNALSSFGIHYASLSIPEIACKGLMLKGGLASGGPLKENHKVNVYEVSAYILQLMGNILLNSKCFWDM